MTPIEPSQRSRLPPTSPRIPTHSPSRWTQLPHNRSPIANSAIAIPHLEPCHPPAMASIYPLLPCSRARHPRRRRWACPRPRAGRLRGSSSAETEVGVSLMTLWPMSAHLVVHGEGGWRADVCVSRCPRRRRSACPRRRGPLPIGEQFGICWPSLLIFGALKPSPPPPRGPLPIGEQFGICWPSLLIFGAI
jgi:hypothetical protein